MYEHWEPKYGKKRRHPLEQQARRAFGQMCLCGGLFFLVFVGQGIFPEKFLYTKDMIVYHFQSQRDFQQAFENLGLALGEDDFSLEELSVFCMNLLGISEEAEAELPLGESVMVFSPEDAYFLNYTPPVLEESFPEGAVMVLAPQSGFSSQELLEQALSEAVLRSMEKSALEEANSEEWTLDQADSQELAEEQMAVGTVISSYEGVEAEGYCFDVLYLGEGETFSPVYSLVTSEFGPRVNPVSGVEGIHRGVDLRAPEGTELYAWRDGVVLEVAENDESGKHLKLDHGDGILSVYAHCSEILVEEGAEVSGGTCLALSGSTGQVTAAHLHFELIWNGLYLNPLHYFEYEGILS